MHDATSTIRHSLLGPAAWRPASKRSPHPCNRDLSRRRRHSEPHLSVDTLPGVGFRASTSAEHLLDAAPQGIKDSIRKRRQSLQPISEVTGKAGFRHLLTSAPISAHKAARAQSSPNLKLERVAIEALSRSIHLHKCSSASSLQESISASGAVIGTPTLKRSMAMADPTFNIRRTRQDHPRSLDMLFRHDKLKLTEKSEREWERDSLRNTKDRFAMLGAAHMRTLDSGLTLM